MMYTMLIWPPGPSCRQEALKHADRTSSVHGQISVASVFVRQAVFAAPHRANGDEARGTLRVETPRVSKNGSQTLRSFCCGAVLTCCSAKSKHDSFVILCPNRHAAALYAAQEVVGPAALRESATRKRDRHPDAKPFPQARSGR